MSMRLLATVGLCWSLSCWAWPAVASASLLFTSGTLRDFCADALRTGAAAFALPPCPGLHTHPNFATGVDLGGTGTGVVNGVAVGVVLDTLGADGKPVLNTAYVGPSVNGSLDPLSHLPIQKPIFTTAADFAQWYNDVPGINVSRALVQPGNGSGSFFPLDGQLSGNQGLGHNYYFTYELHGSFRYEGGEVLQFVSDDDLWVFINGTKALELAGTHNPEAGNIHTDGQAMTLGITPGQSYPIDLFFADRQPVDAVLRISGTPIGIATPIPEPSTSLLFATGLVALGGHIWRRRERKHSCTRIC